MILILLVSTLYNIDIFYLDIPQLFCLTLALAQDLEESESVVHSLPPLAPYAPYSAHPGPYSPTPYYHTLPDSTVYRSPYEEPGTQELQDALRTQDNNKEVSYNPIRHRVLDSGVIPGGWGESYLSLLRTFSSLLA